jgi:putative transposase
MVTAPVRREVVRAMVTRGLSERRVLAVVHMSPSSLRYVPAPD